MNEALLLDKQLCFALYRASRAVIRSYDSLLEPLGVTYPQYLTLLALWEHDGVPVKRLGERLALDSATLTPLLKRLEHQGLVTRLRAEDDERVVRINLTPEGRQLQAKAKSIPHKLLNRCGFGMGDEALRSLVKLREQLNALSESIENITP